MLLFPERRITVKWKQASDAEKKGLKDLKDELHKQILQHRQAENLRKKQKEKKRQRRKFFRDPYKFTSDLLGKPKSGRLQCNIEEVENNIREAHSDELREEPLAQIPIDLVIPPPTYPFDLSELKMEEIRKVVKKARSASAPGPSGIPYKIYKNCPKLMRRLGHLLRVIWRKKTLPSDWTRAEGCFVPKELNSVNLDQFREISLLSIEGKIFWAVIAHRITTYMLKNKYINTSIQKGGIPEHSGCLEHTAAISQLIREARRKKKTLTVVWLDLAKAYPSLPHQVIFQALQHYHIPEEVSNLVREYFNSLKMRFSVGDSTTHWQRLEKGIMTGCTVSVVLFVTAMNLILEAGSKQCRGPRSEDGTQHPVCRAFIDDITVMTQSGPSTRWVLEALSLMVNWARMVFKPRKSRSLFIYKGEVKTWGFKVQGEDIPTIQSESIRCLGKNFDESLKDTNNVKELVETVKKWLTAIDRSELQGRFKTWCFQYGIIPRLQWPFQMYNIPITIVQQLSRICSKHLRKWLGVPPGFSSVNLHSRSSKLVLPFKEVEEEFKATKVRGLVTLQSSKDEKARETWHEMSQGRGWRAEEATNKAREALKHQEVLEIVCKKE